MIITIESSWGHKRYAIVKIRIGDEEYLEYVGRIRTLAIIHILERNGRPIELKLFNGYRASYDVDEDIANLIRVIMVSPRINLEILNSPDTILEDMKRYSKLPISMDIDGIHIDVYKDHSHIVLGYSDSKSKIKVEYLIESTKYSWNAIKRFIESPTKYICEAIRRGLIFFKEEDGWIKAKNALGGDFMSDRHKKALIYALRKRITFYEAFMII